MRSRWRCSRTGMRGGHGRDGRWARAFFAGLRAGGIVWTAPFDVGGRDPAGRLARAMVPAPDLALASALNEQELWREMVRWSGGRIVEEQGVLLVSGPSAYLRVAIRADPRVDGSAVVARATWFFWDQP